MITKRIVVNWLTKRHISSIVNTTQQKETTAMTNSKQTTTFENVQVGDKIYTIGRGWGNVIRVNYTPYMAVQTFVARFDNGREIGADVSGKQITPEMTSINQVVFWGEPQFEIPVKPATAPPVDTLVMVTGIDGSSILRYSAGELNAAGNLFCFDGGVTSKTTGTELAARGKSPWVKWEIV